MAVCVVYVEALSKAKGDEASFPCSCSQVNYGNYVNRDHRNFVVSCVCLLR